MSMNTMNGHPAWYFDDVSENRLDATYLRTLHVHAKLVARDSAQGWEGLCSAMASTLFGWQYMVIVLGSADTPARVEGGYLYVTDQRLQKSLDQLEHGPK